MTRILILILLTIPIVVSANQHTESYKLIAWSHTANKGIRKVTIEDRNLFTFEECDLPFQNSDIILNATDLINCEVFYYRWVDLGMVSEANFLTTTNTWLDEFYAKQEDNILSEIGFNAVKSSLLLGLGTYSLYRYFKVASRLKKAGYAGIVILSALEFFGTTMELESDISSYANLPSLEVQVFEASKSIEYQKDRGNFYAKSLYEAIKDSLDKSLNTHGRYYRDLHNEKWNQGN